MKRTIILGSTGSIGRNTLKVISNFPQQFKVIGLSANSNIRLLSAQIENFSPEMVAVKDVANAKRLEKRYRNLTILKGEEGIQKLATTKVDLLVMAISGSSALLPLLEALEIQPAVALANKEALVMAGSLIMQKARKFKTRILPVDSEQSAIWQCLEGKEKVFLKKIYLTASGGPLKDIDEKEFKNISLEKVLNHPRWKMGKKISVDSATLMNKGLELFETIYLFEVDVSKIEVIIHPEAIIHSMVEFIDGSVLAQLSVTDMRIPIQYALSYPQRFSGFLPPLNFFKIKSLSFYKPDFNKFPCLELAYEVARRGGSLPTVLNISNEVAVEAFLKKRISFSHIPWVIEKVISLHRNIPSPDLEDILNVQEWARRKSEETIKKITKVI
ncbi:MAG: 1-deoxy-D-xylulose-5-phosphate reductoisomerase [Candidatus Omnitrophica bacterium]|nr:1-deoxy-D-xylulose-5-phosphate reductoisomerase [Candidatus Omnitrophota bacterium]